LPRHNEFVRTSSVTISKFLLLPLWTAGIAAIGRPWADILAATLWSILNSRESAKTHEKAEMLLAIAIRSNGVVE
jgi:hypothetical protein